MANDYSGIENVKTKEERENRGPPYLTEGVYPELEIVSFTDGISKKTGMQFAKLHVKVLRSEGPDAVPAGQEAVHILSKKPSDRFGYYLKDVKAIAMAVLNEPVTEKLMKELIETNAAAGIKVSGKLLRKERNGKSFTEATFKPVEKAAKAKK